VFDVNFGAALALVEKQGKVSHIAAEGNYFRIGIDGTGDAPSQCHIGVDTEYKRAILSVLTTAIATDQIVWIGGGNECKSKWLFNSPGR
jgi:hypothetical protein